MPPRTRHDRYSVTGESLENSFYDSEAKVLVNKLELREEAKLQAAEERGLVLASGALLFKAAPDQVLTAQFIQDAHRQIFGHIYEWAGKWRSVSIAKGGMKWPPPMFLAQNMEQLEREVLSKYPPSTLRDDGAFVNALARIQGEFLAVHPFREGNARTIKLCTNVLAIQTGRPQLAYDSTPEGRDRFIHANKAVVYNVDYSLLEREIGDALERSRVLLRQKAQTLRQEPER